MPMSPKTGFHLNTQRMHAADRMSAKPMEPKKEMSGVAVAEHEPEGEEKESIAHITIHKHADGTHSTETEGGEKMEHPTLGHALVHAAAHHEPDSSHMHIKHDGMGGLESHHVGEDGQAQGPHEHPDVEALKSHLDKFLGEEGKEHEGGEPMGMEGHEVGMEGLTGL